MRRLIIAAAATFAAGAAIAEDDVANAYVGHTVDVTHGDGSRMSWFFEADGTVANSAGENGVYVIDGTIMCFDMEGADGEVYIDGYDANHAPGDEWTLTYGEDVMSVTLVEGR